MNGIVQIQPSWFDQYNKFADACGIPKGSLLDPPNLEALDLAKRLVQEEWLDETQPALYKYATNPSLENLVALGDGITDSIYVLCQLARAAGIPLNLFWNNVQKKNMEKVGPDGMVTKREDGKILKPAGWEPPEKLHFEALLLAREGEERVRQKYGAENWGGFPKQSPIGSADEWVTRQYNDQQDRIEQQKKDGV